MMNTIEELLQHREARGLHYTIFSRILIALSAMIVTPMVAQSAFEIIITYGLMTLVLGIMGYFLVLLYKRNQLKHIGLGGVLLDLLILSALPVIWYHSIGGQDVAASSMLKTQLPLISSILIVINSLAMRPLYPALITIGAVGIHLGLVMFVIMDPRTIWSSDLVEVFSGTAVSFGLYLFILSGILLIGALTTFATHSSRHAIYEAAVFEHANVLIQETQAQMILQGKMDAVSRLVAGIAHEMNNPISVVKSATDSAERSIKKLTSIMEKSQTLEQLKEDERFQIILKFLTDSYTIIGAASDRITNTVERIQHFTRLDEAEFQIADIHRSLDNTSSLLRSRLQDRIVVIKEYGKIPPIYYSPRQLNYVFLELLINAIQAIEDAGTITIRTSLLPCDAQAVTDDRPSTDRDPGKQHIRIQIADTGKGILPEQIDNLFDMNFTQQRSRVGMSMSLPIIYSIIHKHGGDITVKSEVGKGTIFNMTLPVKPEERRSL